jgi:serine/threonine protein kinase
MSKKLGKLIGEGSFGKVYELGKDKVVKYIHLTGDGLLDYIEPFILSNLKHENIMNSDQISIGECGLLKILMNIADPISNLSLRDIKKDKLNLALQVKEGLTYLHNLTIVHGDIKPSNILKIGNCYKISDFGLSILLYSDPQKIDKLIYTDKYRPPENYNYIISRKSDIWAFGKMLEEYFTPREMEKRGFKSYLGRKLEDRICFSENNYFLSDQEIIQKNKYLLYSEECVKVFCQKLRNDGKEHYSCSEKYLDLENNLFSNGRMDIDLFS